MQEAEPIAESGASIPEPPAAAQKPKDPFEDRSKVWETMAALQYRADGVADGPQEAAVQVSFQVNELGKARILPGHGSGIANEMGLRR